MTAAVKSSSAVKDACKDIQKIDAQTSGYEEKVKTFFKQLPEDAQNALNALPGVGDVNKSLADLAKVLSFAACRLRLCHREWRR